jgi:putative membrane protein
MRLLDRGSLDRAARRGWERVGQTFGWDEEEPGAGEVVRGIAAGLIGGLVASLVLDGIEKVMSAPKEKRERMERRRGRARGGGQRQPVAYTPEAIAQEQEQPGNSRPKRARGAGGGQTGERRQQQPSQNGEEPEPPEKLASIIAEKVFQTRLPPPERAAAGAAVHLGFGTVIGGLYGGLAEVWPTVGVGVGTAYGTCVWALADETALPVFGLDKPPMQRETAEHAESFAMHLVYGAVLDVVRRGVRSLF